MYLKASTFTYLNHFVVRAVIAQQLLITTSPAYYDTQQRVVDEQMATMTKVPMLDRTDLRGEDNSIKDAIQENVDEKLESYQADSK